MSFGHINGGYTHNVIPNSIKLLGTLRYLDESTKIELHNCISNIITNYTDELNIRINHTIVHASPQVINEKKLTDIFLKSTINTLGAENVIDLELPSMGGEDFSYYLSHCPGIYFRIGCSNGKVTDLHTANFDLDEKCIPTAIDALYNVIYSYFS